MLRFEEENMKKSFMLPLALSVTVGLCGPSLSQPTDRLNSSSVKSEKHLRGFPDINDNRIFYNGELYSVISDNYPKKKLGEIIRNIYCVGSDKLTVENAKKSVNRLFLGIQQMVSENPSIKPYVILYIKGVLLGTCNCPWDYFDNYASGEEARSNIRGVAEYQKSKLKDLLSKIDVEKD